MPIVDSHAEVAVKGTHEAFRHVVSPFHVQTDFPWNYGPASWYDNSEMVHDLELQCVYPAPRRVPHNQQVSHYYNLESLDCGGVDLPRVEWGTVGASIPIDFRCSQPLGFSEIYLPGTQNSQDDMFFEAEANVGCQGVSFLWARYAGNERYSDFPDIGAYVTFRVHVGTGVNERIYSVSHRGQGEVTVQMSDDLGVTWKELDKVATGADVWKSAWGEADPVTIPDGWDDPDNQATDLPYDYNVLEFRLLAGRLSIRVASMDRIYVYDEARIDEEGQPIWKIEKVSVKAYKFVNLALSAHPTKWSNVANYDSQEIPIGFYSENFTDPYIDSAGVVPPGWLAHLIDPTSLTGPIVYYRLELTGFVDGAYKNRSWCDYVAAVRAVNLIWLAEVLPTGGFDRNAAPEVAEVEFAFNPDTLTVNSAASMTYNNNRPLILPTTEIGFWGEWAMNYGQFGMACNMYRSVDGPVDLSARVFTGYGGVSHNTDGEAGASQTVVRAADRSIQLMSPRFALPWMDGWNVFYAQAYLSQLGHVDFDDLTYGYLVPDSPFDDWGDEDGNPAYFLPVGTAGSVLTRHSATQIWQVKQKISKSIGYVLGHDVYGHEVFRKFRLPVGVKRAFYESDVESGYINGCWSVRSWKDMSEVRSDSIIVGVDAFEPLARTIAVKTTDPDVQYNFNAFNHLGYSMPAVWVDSQFANWDFAVQASQETLAFMRLPGLGLTFTTWLNPDIAPLDVVTFYGQKFGISGIPMMVLSVKHRVTKSLGMTTISAMYVPIP